MMSLIKYIYSYVVVDRLCPTLAIPWTVACQAPLLCYFPGKNSGVGFHFLPNTSIQLLYNQDVEYFHHLKYSFTTFEVSAYSITTLFLFGVVVWVQ